MKKFLVNLVVMTLFVNFAISQQKAPVMNFAKTKHDFGNLKQENGPASVRFTFVNTGGSPIVIKNVESSCGCTTPSWTKQPIVPGAKGYVDAVYDPRNRPGHFSKTVTVYSNAVNSPVVLNITGNVLEKQNPIEEQYPQKVGDLNIDKIYLNFGNMFNDQKKTLSFHIYNASDKDLKIVVEDRYKPPYATIKVSPAILKPKQNGKIMVTYDASKVHDWDYVRGFVYLTINGKRIYNRRLQISAIIKERFTKKQIQNPPKIEFDSKTFSFDTIKQGQIIHHIFTFKNTGKSDLIIRKTQSSCGCTAVAQTNTPIKPGHNGEIKVTFNSTYKRYRQIKTITVITNCPENKYNKIILRISGYVIPKNNKKK
jgi:hypothetical protein